AMVGGGGTDGTTTMSIVQNVYGFSGTTISDPDLGGAGSAGLVTYTAGAGISSGTFTGSGLRPLDLTTEYKQSIGAVTSPNDNVRVTAAEAVGGATTMNGLVLHGASYTVSGAPLTITSGMVVSAVTGTETATVSNNINFGSARGTIISVGSSTSTF